MRGLEVLEYMLTAPPISSNEFCQKGVVWSYLTQDASSPRISASLSPVSVTREHRKAMLMHCAVSCMTCLQVFGPLDPTIQRVCIFVQLST